jgi:hypothetical protein
MMLYSDNEEYLSQRMTKLFDVSSNAILAPCSDPVLYLRVIGTVAPDMKESITLRSNNV